MAAQWIDLLDPSEEELREASPVSIRESALELLLAPPAYEREPRPTLWGHGDYVFGFLLSAVADRERNKIYYQEVGLVLTHDTIVTVRKTPPGDHPPYEVTQLRDEVQEDDSAGMIAYRLVDDIAECYLDLVDALDAEVDELEDLVDHEPAAVTRTRASDLRHDLLHVRRTLGPMRDAVRRVVLNAVEVTSGPPVFPQDVEIAFNGAYDKFLRALDGLELVRDLLASVRDYQQSKISIDQNDVTKKLTVVASLLLAPTFVVGIYGQNFQHMPELRWRFGYAYSWGIIVLITLGQLWYYRRKRWI